MGHLTDEQFEDIIQGVRPEPGHLSECERCRVHLVEQKAVAARLRSAFASVEPDEKLSEKIRARLANEAETPKLIVFVKRLRASNVRRAGWPAAAAAVIAIAVLLGVYFARPSSVMAAEAELVRIHEHNLSSNHEFHSEADPEKLAAYFKEKLGFSPSMPRVGQGLSLRGCCVRHFRGQVVGSYVVDTPEGVMSVVVVTDRPESLGMGEKFRFGEYTFWKSSFAKCDMVTVGLGDYSYCAVGEISHEYLTSLLIRLLPDSEP
jgi:hypothetical protein